MSTYAAILVLPPFFLLYPTNALETLAPLKKTNLNASHLSAPPLLPAWFSSGSASGWIVTVACYLASLIDYLCGGALPTGSPVYYG